MKSSQSILCIPNLCKRILKCNAEYKKVTTISFLFSVDSLIHNDTMILYHNISTSLVKGYVIFGTLQSLKAEMFVNHTTFHEDPYYENAICTIYFWVILRTF